MIIETPYIFNLALLFGCMLIFIAGLVAGAERARRKAHAEFNKVVRAGYMVVDGRTYRMLDITGDGTPDLYKAAGVSPSTPSGYTIP